MKQLFASGGQSIGVSSSTSDLPVNTQDWSPIGWTGCISVQSKHTISKIFPKNPVKIIYENSVWYNCLYYYERDFLFKICHGPENQDIENHYSQEFTVTNCPQKQHSRTVQCFWCGCYCSMGNVILYLVKWYILLKSINFFYFCLLPKKKFYESNFDHFIIILLIAHFFPIHLFQVTIRAQKFWRIVTLWITTCS